jgi:hypothetical protein
MATNSRRAILRETDNLSVAQIRPVACFYDSILGARGKAKSGQSLCRTLYDSLRGFGCFASRLQDIP